MLKINKNDELLIRKIHLLSGVEEGVVRKVIDAMIAHLCLNYKNKEKMTIPILGDLEIERKEEIITLKGRGLDIDIKLNVTDYFKEIVMDIDDGNLSSIENNLINKIISDMRKIGNFTEKDEIE